MRLKSLVLGAALLAIGAGTAHAQPLCGNRAEILKKLNELGEQQNALGLSADGGVLEILVSPKGGWTILVTYPEHPTCVIAIGRAWQTVKPKGEPA